MSTLRKRLQANLFACLPENVMEGEAAFEADELYQNAGEKKQEAPRLGRPAAPTWQQGQGAGHL